jgi:riboflavin kinase/FMN adenylyltransferase
MKTHVRIRNALEVGACDRRLALGCFDGVHAGHREVVRGCDSALTFDPHPLAVLDPGRAPKLLTELPERAERLARAGIQEVLVLPFDATVATVPPERFLDFLAGGLGAVHVAIGENFRFGRKAAGTPELLAADGRFSTRIVPLQEESGRIASSSRARDLIAAGEVSRATSLLGQPPRLHTSIVRRPNGTPGRLEVTYDERFACPADGSYVALADGRPAITHLATQSGGAPRFEVLFVHGSVPQGQTALTVDFCQRLSAGAQANTRMLELWASAPEAESQTSAGALNVECQTPSNEVRRCR